MALPPPRAPSLSHLGRHVLPLRGKTCRRVGEFISADCADLRKFFLPHAKARRREEGKDTGKEEWRCVLPLRGKTQRRVVGADLCVRPLFFSRRGAIFVAARYAVR